MHAPTCYLPALLLGAVASALTAAEPRILLVESEKQTVLLVEGLPVALLEQVEDPSGPRAEDVLSVYVGSEPRPERPPMLGRYEVAKGQLRFLPRFPLKAGLAYRAVCRLGPDRTVERVFTLAKEEPGEPTRVEAVYPSGDILPENQLKFYVHFSAPMAQGDAYQLAELIDDASQQPVELPFVDVGRELWDRSGERITLLMDPGRIKRGLRPREELGPILREGHTYTLRIRGNWPDARGNVLAQEYRKTFRVVAPDDTQPDPAAWVVQPPRAGSRSPLLIDLGEPLDHAMLGRVVEIVDGADRPVAGEIEITAGERRWSFRPQTAWAAGAYRIVAETTLEDLAGNSIAKPFEVDIFHRVEPRIQRKTVAVPFRVCPEH